MASKVSHSDLLVARIRAAVGLGIPTKVIACRVGISLATVRRYADGVRRQSVAADPMFVDAFDALLRGEG